MRELDYAEKSTLEQSGPQYAIGGILNVVSLPAGAIITTDKGRELGPLLKK